MIKICDAMMGSGKTSAAINYMNEHKDEHFIFITPYLEESERIRDGCRDLWFAEPSNKIPQYGFSKVTHTAALIKEGRNVTTTHAAFKQYTNEMLDDIRRVGYTLIIDEDVDLLEELSIDPYDIELLKELQFVEERDGRYFRTDREYNGIIFSELLSTLLMRDFMRVDDVSGATFYYWVFSPILLNSFRDVIALTYMFKGQQLHYFLEMYDLPFEYMGVCKDAGGNYRFFDGRNDPAAELAEIRKLIHIEDDDKLNKVGKDRFSLSLHWYNKEESDVHKVANNLWTFFNRRHGDIPPEQRMWGVYGDAKSQLVGKGYKNGFVPFNSRATNKYRDRTCLAYAVNVYMNVSLKLLYRTNGIVVDDDKYALGVMVQWIWRSAIRDGREIYIYIPSKRMRNLLISWMNSGGTGGDVLE